MRFGGVLLELLGAYLGGLWGSWGPLLEVLEAFWRIFEGFMGVLEAKLE